MSTLQLLGEAIAAALQLIVVSLIVLGCYLLFQRRQGGLWAYVGLTPAPWRPVGMAAIAAVCIVGFSVVNIDFVRLASAPGTVVAKFHDAGPTLTSLIALPLVAVVKTALSEEILFRGVIGKALIRRFGFAIGNAGQAILFGAVHLPLLWAAMGADGPSPALAAGVATITAFGWVGGWLNEKHANGSILPGWTLHGLANLGSYALMAYVLPSH